MASEIKVDTVSEKTSANGVTIDGVNIKDSKIVTANSVDSDVYVDGSIDTAHIADLNVTTGKIAADAITAAKIADNAVVTAGINADAVTGAKIADDAINSEHYTDGSIDTAHIADGQITIGKLATAVLTGATDIGAAIVDADLFLVDDGAGGTLRKTAASRLKTFIGGGGKVGQVVQSTSTTATATTGGYTAMVPTGTITCAATSSKVLVQWSATIRLYGNDNTSTDKGYNLQLRRTPSGGSNTDYVFGGNTAYKFVYHALDTFGATEQIRVQAHFMYLDSPSSTAALTYTPMMKVHQSSGTVCFDSSTAHLILTEVLA